MCEIKEIAAKAAESETHMTEEHQLILNRINTYAEKGIFEKPLFAPQP